MPSSVEYPLRPLTIGEIFDRAVTIYVRNFVVFTLIVLTLLAPLGIIEMFTFPSNASIFAQNSKPEAWNDKQIVAIVVVALLATILAPLINNAVALGVARLYNGERPSYGSAFAAVLRRSLPLLGTAMINLMMLGTLYGSTVMFIVLLAAFGAVFLKSALPVAIALFVLAGIALLAVIPLFLMLLIVYAFSMYATTIERADPGRAISSGLSRVFGGRSEIKKAFLMALAYVGLEIGVLAISATVGILLTATLKLDALQVIFSTIVNALLTAFLAILLAVYYYDVRTRKEGLDLETDLQRLIAAG